jgi:Glycosyltransferase Family 4
MNTPQNNKKVLIISFYFPPSFNPGSVRMGKFAKYLPEFGWDPIILTADRKTSSSEIMPLEMDELSIYRTPYSTFGDWISTPLVGQPLADSPNSIKQSDKPSLRKQLLLRSVRMLRPFYTAPLINKLIWDPMGWLPFALKKGKEIIAQQNIDIILSTYNPSLPHLIASKLSKQSGIPWVADFRDLWSHNPYFKKTQPFQLFEEHWEKRVIKNSDYLISVSNPLINDLESFHSKKVAVIYNGFDDADFKENIPSCSKFTITYTGQIYSPTSDPEPLFQVLAELKREGIVSSSSIEVRFFGRFLVNNPAILSIKYDIADIVHVHGFIPLKESIKKQKESSALLLLGWNDPQAAGDITSKFFEYMGAGKPILAIAYQGGELNQLIQKADVGVIVNTPIQIKELLLRWLTEFKQYGKVISYFHPNNEVVKHYTRKEETKELACILNQVSLKNGTWQKHK